jgi:hypothetical protein
LEEVFEHEKHLQLQRVAEKNGQKIEEYPSKEVKNYPEINENFPLPMMMTVPSSNNGECNNLNFELGNFQNWTGKTAIYTIAQDINVENEIVHGRHTLFGPGSSNDYYGGFPKVKPGGNFSVMLGNNQTGAQTESISNTFVVTDENKFFTYYYAVVLNIPGPDHELPSRPRFTSKVIHNGQVVECSEFTATAGEGIAGFKNYSKDVIYKPWSNNIIDLSEYLNQEVTIEFKTYDCAYGGHFGYAYIDGSCIFDGINYEDKNDCAKTFKFTSTLLGLYESEIISWEFGDGETSNEAQPYHTYQNDGNYTVSFSISNSLNPNCKLNISRDIEVKVCEEDTCSTCIPSFAPPSGKYIVSAWVKEKDVPATIHRYEDAFIEISFENSSVISELHPKGQIIDGWQRIEEEIFIPTDATQLKIALKTSGNESYFDDIRFFPYDGSMMSYVYDPISLRLMAELDERNYSTLYEYDEEGKLIRVKKETEKGVMTIQENRDNIKK